MAVISFAENSPNAAWVVAGWAFRQILADVIRYRPGDGELADLLRHAEDVGYLYVDTREQQKVASAIKEVAAAILRGEIQSGISERFDDEETATEYRKGLKMLIDAALAAEIAKPHDNDG